MLVVVAYACVLWWVVDQGELLECRPNPERVVLVNGKVVWMVLSHRRRSWMVSVWGGWVELEVAESVGGKWGLLDGCGVRNCVKVGDNICCLSEQVVHLGKCHCSFV